MAGVAACGRRGATGLPGYALIANEQGRTVALIDLDNLRVARHVSFDESPTAVLTHPSRECAYVLTPRTGFIHELAVPSLAVTRRQRLAPSLHSVRMSGDGTSLWALARDARSLIEWRLPSGPIGHRLRLPAAPADIDLSRDGVAGVSFPDDGRIGLWRLDSGKLLHLVNIGGRPSTLRFRFDGRQVLAGLPGHRMVVVIDVATGRVVTRLPLAIEPESFCFKQDGGVLFVTGSGFDAVASIFPYRDMVAETFLAGRTPGAMAISGSLDPLLFVANPSTGDVTVVDATTSKVIAAVAVGQEPSHIMVTPDDRYALVLNRRSGDVAVLLLEALRNRRVRPAPPPLFTLIRVGAGPVSGAVKLLG